MMLNSTQSRPALPAEMYRSADAIACRGQLGSFVQRVYNRKVHETRI